MNFSQNDITTYPPCWDIYSAQIEAEPIITTLTVIVYTNTISIDSNASILIEIFFKNL